MVSPSPPKERRGGRFTRWLALLGCGVLAMLVTPAIAQADELPPGFVEQTVLEGLNQPTAVQFAPDGRIFVAEKDGRIKVFDRLRDPTPELFVDLRREVNAVLDRGLLGLALSPDFANDEAVYVAYTHDAPEGGTAPTYGYEGDPDNPEDDWLDYCSDACEVTGRVSRLTPDGTNPPDEEVLLEDWCQQWFSHSIGALEFDAQGRLYISGGDGANYNQEDYGQTYVLTDAGEPYDPVTNPYISPPNTCGDPGSPEGEAPPNPAVAEGGALRSQDLQTGSDPLSLSGTIARIDPDAPGAPGVSDNPLYSAGSATSNASRIVASGLRNPFRIALAPDGGVWLGDVGWRTWEELNSFDPDGATVPNFGWPCFEGDDPTQGYSALGIGICEDLYNTPNSVKDPEFFYDHRDFLYEDDPCPVPGGGSSTSGIEFYEGTSFPAAYDDALFFTDYSRSCIWVMFETAGEPDPSTIEAFNQHLIAPVDLEVGPGGALYYVDLGLGEIRRIQYFQGNLPPVAQIQASPMNPDVGEEVSFDAEGSTDPDLPIDLLIYAWDLDGDGAFDDSLESQPEWTYNAPGPVTVSLRVTDALGETDETSVTIGVGNAPVPAIASPGPGALWETGEVIALRGGATDVEPGALTLRWDVDLHHCLPGGGTGSGCHVHTLPSAFGPAYDLVGPEHEYPAKLTVRLTATDSDGLSTTVERDYQPRTVDLRVESQPTGASLGINGSTAAGPRTLIKNSTTSVSAASPQQLGLFSYDWCGWSDGGAQTHAFPATTSRTLTASFCGGRPSTTLSLSNSLVDEMQPPGTVVGTLGTDEQDPADRYSYTLVDGPGADDNAAFRIDGATLVTATTLNRESRSSLSIRVRADDGYGNALAQPLTIDVGDVDDPPTDLALSSATVGEHLMVGTGVGTLSAGDEDGDQLDYSLVSGPGDRDNSDFRVSGDQLETARVLDYRDGDKRSIRVRVADGRGGALERTLGIEVVAAKLRLKQVKLRIPRQAAQLTERGVRAKLRCSLDCEVEVELRGRGRLARQVGLRGTIGEGRANLAEGEAQWITARLNRGAVRKLDAAGADRAPRLIVRYDARRSG